MRTYDALHADEKRRAAALARNQTHRLLPPLRWPAAARAMKIEQSL